MLNIKNEIKSAFLENKTLYLMGFSNFHHV